MPIIVNTNISSINAQRNLAKSSGIMAKSLERLSSGLRINRAGDDAAGLALATGLQAQIRGLAQSVRNANDGLSVVGTAEGAIGTAETILQRIRELSVQAANAINSGDNRQAIQDEISLQIQELTRIGNSVEFNGLKLIDGSFNNKSLQVGAYSGQTISMSLIDFRATSIGKIATRTSTNGVDTAVNLTGATPAGVAGSLYINSITVGSSVGLDTTSFANGNGSAIAKAAAINAVSSQTGVTAKVGATVVTGGAVVAGNLNAALTINNVTVADASNPLANVLGNDTSGVLRARINQYSNQTGVVATFDAASTTLKLTAADGRNITIAGAGVGLSIPGVVAGTTGGKLTLVSNETFTIESAAAETNIIGLGAAQTNVALDNTTALSNINVATVAGASSAIDTVDSALKQLNESRASLGAITNRLENTITNLETSIENLTASESRIRDADFAVETATLTRTQILQQAGVAVLSQANMTSQAALALLGQ